MSGLQNVSDDELKSRINQWQEQIKEYQKMDQFIHRKKGRGRPSDREILKEQEYKNKLKQMKPMYDQSYDIIKMFEVELKSREEEEQGLSNLTTGQSTPRLNKLEEIRKMLEKSIKKMPEEQFPPEMEEEEEEEATSSQIPEEIYESHKVHIESPETYNVVETTPERQLVAEISSKSMQELGNAQNVQHISKLDSVKKEAEEMLRDMGQQYISKNIISLDEADQILMPIVENIRKASSREEIHQFEQQGLRYLMDKENEKWTIEPASKPLTLKEIQQQKKHKLDYLTEYAINRNLQDLMEQSKHPIAVKPVEIGIEPEEEEKNEGYTQTDFMQPIQKPYQIYDPKTKTYKYIEPIEPSKLEFIKTTPRMFETSNKVPDYLNPNMFPRKPYTVNLRIRK